MRAQSKTSLILIRVLEKAGVVKAKDGGYESKDFVDTEVARLA